MGCWQINVYRFTYLIATTQDFETYSLSANDGFIVHCFHSHGCYSDKFTMIVLVELCLNNFVHVVDFTGGLSDLLIKRGSRGWEKDKFVMWKNVSASKVLMSVKFIILFEVL